MMYFQQVDEIAQGLKTCTQRVQKSGECPWGEPIRRVLTGAGRLKWEVDGEYAVSPGRGKLTVRVCFDYDPPMLIYPETREQDDVYRRDGMAPLLIRITKIESVRLQDMDEVVARAEGVESVDAYRDLWQSINGKRNGSRWDDNPLVWRLWFEVVK